MEVLSNKIDRKQLKPGDHIYVWRQAYLYAHHGIYVQEEMVIHFTRETSGTQTLFDRLFTSSFSALNTHIPCQKCVAAKQTRSNGVILSCLDCFLSGGEPCLFLYGVNKLHFLNQARGGTCTLASSDPADEVIHRANYLVENGFGGYHVSENNCEDFAIYCKTGLRVITNDSVGGGSGQAIRSAVKSVVRLAVRYYSPTFFGRVLYSGKRLVSDIGYREDVTKVPVEKI
ncbi:unnamed protein product [Lathyrus oleraceus]